MGRDKKWCPTRLNSWPFVFLYINDLPEIINIDANMIFFADDTSILVTNPNIIDFNINTNQTWFKDNLLP